MHRIKPIFLWAVSCPDWLMGRARTISKTPQPPLMRDSTPLDWGTPKDPEGPSLVDRPWLSCSILFAGVQGPDDEWPHTTWTKWTARAVQAPPLTVTLALMDLSTDPFVILRDQPSLWTLTEGTSAPDARAWCEPEMRLPGIVVRSKIL